MTLRLPFIGIQTRLFLYSLLLILVALTAGGLILEEWLKQWRVEEIERDLVLLSRSAVVHLQEMDRDLADAAMDHLANRLGEESGSRVTFIAQDGHVIGDSSVSVESLLHIESHARRPEVIQALSMGQGSSVRHSTTVDQDMLYVATLHNKPGHKVVVRVARSLEEVQNDIVEMRFMIFVAALPALLLATLVSSIAGRFATRSLRTLIRTADALAGGTSARQQLGATSPQNDIDHLALSFTLMEVEVKRLMEGLSRERDRLRTILEGMAEAVIAVDQDGLITLANPAASSLLHLHVSPVGRYLEEILPRETSDCLQTPQPGQKTWRTEFDLNFQQLRRVQAYAACPADGGCVLVLRDVTDQRRLETMRRDLIASASHELRTPVSVIRLNAETLLDGALEETQHARPLVEAIERQALRLSHLVSDMLDLSLLESGRYHMVTAQIQPFVVAERVITALTPLAEGKGTILINEVEPALRAVADGRALEQVFINLLNNAIKYTPSNGRVVVTCSPAPAPGQLQLEVIDSGPGIDPNHHAMIFERFYRVDPGRSREVGGTGLGLTIVKHLVETMGGKVGVELVEPHGSCFWFTLPAAVRQEEEDDDEE